MMFAIGSIRGRTNLGHNYIVKRESLVLLSFLFQQGSNLSSLHKATSVTPLLNWTTSVNLRSYRAVIPFLEAVRVSSPNFLLTQRLNVFASHSVLRSWVYRRWMSRASFELKTDNDVVRFAFGKQPGKNGSSEKRKKTTKRVKMSRKAKLNELRFYRLKAKKKKNSPNPEVRIRYKLEKAKRKEVWLIEKLRKFEVPKIPAEVYDPEILTEEEKHYLKRTGEKKKNFVLVGRRGVFGGVVLNMHLHWKKHETVKVICRPCKPGQIHEYAEELARLSKGIVIDIKPNNSIVFYRGKNYVQPEVMSPPNTLSKQKALEKYKYEQSLEHTSQFIEKLEKELEEYLEHVARYRKLKEDTQYCTIAAA
ncbi:hypothetical protein JCGZ_09572 [Jatropha curcas]|uniref:CRM domain-containing protein n=1 Tax=Jatropha curcas TaxID=180498 RepID=A0A067LDM8_JATCU|nr:uncharacterized CRM domain-containing protein At3g25440, chloroplastic [Jatropha curcas]XP_012081312.1 uncharacterized CRM domain-containing protein At3g25440, chloroplastic [Jatropha curcas]XP_020537863.1 uncharacterized CRM domain-containing protein At3g25440, chloroplastic [Jatropha curcas]KDP45323.1 hypothetical protein JCGZ_09572 [Jatropha curcas]